MVEKQGADIAPVIPSRGEGQEPPGVPVRPTLARSSLLMAGFTVVSMALRYGFLVASGWLLSTEEYGILGVSIAILTIGGLFFTAYPWALTKFASEGNGRFAFKGVLLGNLVLAFAFCSLLLASYAFGGLNLGERGALLIALLIATGIVSAVGGVYEGALKGLFRFRQLGLIRTVDQLLILAGIFFVLLGWGTLGAVFGFLLSAVTLVFLGWYCTRDQGLSTGGRWLQREVHAFAWPMLFSGASAYLIMNLDILGIKFWGGQNANGSVGYYQAALVLARLPLLVVLSTVLEAFFPFVAYTAGDKDKVEAYVSRTLKYSLVFCLPISLTLALRSQQILGVFFPDGYESGATALSVLASATFMLSFVFIFSRTLQATLGPKRPAVILTGAALLQVALLRLLVPTYGISGAATATAIASAAGLAGLVWLYTRSYRIVLTIRHLAALVLAGAFMTLLLVALPASTFPTLVGGLALSGIAFIVTIVALKGVDPEDAELLFAGLSRRDSQLKTLVLRMMKVLSRA